MSSRKRQDLLGCGGVQSISQASSDAECIVDVESVDDHHHHHRSNVTTLELSANQSGLNPILIENEDDEDFGQVYNLDTSIVNIEENIDDENDEYNQQND